MIKKLNYYFNLQNKFLILFSREIFLQFYIEKYLKLRKNICGFDDILIFSSLVVIYI